MSIELRSVFGEKKWFPLEAEHVAHANGPCSDDWPYRETILALCAAGF